MTGCWRYVKWSYQELFNAYVHDVLSNVLNSLEASMCPYLSSLGIFIVSCTFIAICIVRSSLQRSVIFAILCGFLCPSDF